MFCFQINVINLISTNDCGQVTQVGAWFTGDNSYLYRFNAKPKTDTEHALVLDDYNVRFNINANYSIYNYRRARGMVARSIENS